MTPSYAGGAYVDSSVLLAIAFNEPTAPEMVQRLAGFPRLVSSNLLEAEVRSALAREGGALEPPLMSHIRWVLPTRPLGPEISDALRAGYLRGADLWHIATALYAARSVPGLAFVTLDRRQGGVAAALGFAV